MSHSLLTMRRICKRFGATVALDEVDFALRYGEVHAVIGENGAGKSTLMKVLAGACRPDSGEMALADPDPHPSIADRPKMLPFSPRNPAAARDSGVTMIYQERNLAPDMSVEANVMLGLERRRPWQFLDRKALREPVEEALAALDHTDIDPRTPIGRLGPAKQQVVEIARALVLEARVVVMDEPTSSLSEPDVKRLFETIGQLKERGVGIVFISHFLEEILEVADYYTAMRDGRTVDSGRAPEANLTALIRVMTGRTVGELFPRVDHEFGEQILKIDQLAGDRLPHSTDLSLRRGEILGMFGLVGAGRTELLRALYGLDSAASGTVAIKGDVDQGHPTPYRKHQGLGMLSEDRQHEGLARNQTITDNMTYGGMDSFTSFGLLSRKRQSSTVQTWVERLGVRARHLRQPVEDLSGGNQQKVALARLLHWNADVILLDEPTRGIDVASKATIYEVIGQLAAEGKAVLFVSNYLPELMGVCDTICVMHRGRLSEKIDAQEADAHQIMSLATTGEPIPIQDSAANELLLLE